MENAVLDALRQLGLSLYEARLYLGLLRHGSQNGNELSRTSGVPSSKVYSTLEKLTAAGVVHSVRRGTTTRFVCIPPGELVARLRQQFTDPLDFLEEHLPPLAEFRTGEEFLTVAGSEAVRETTRSIVDIAHSEIHISCWADELEPLRGALAAAEGRGVRIFGMVYAPDDEPPPPGSWTHHSYQDIVGTRLGGRMLSLVVDDDESFVAHIPDGGEPKGVRTRNPVLTLIVQEYLHHDIVLQRAQLNIGFDEWDRWWTADPDLRSIILGSALARDAEAVAEPDA